MRDRTCNTYECMTVQTLFNEVATLAAVEKLMRTLLYNILWMSAECFILEGMLNIQNSYLWALNNSHAVCECGYQVYFIVGVWLGIVRDIVMACMCDLTG